MSAGRILVVDDEADIRKTVSFTLSKSGYDIVEAEDGEDAMNKIREGDNPLRVDTIICDMQMPKVNGMEAIAFFRQQFPSVPVIVLTGNPEIQGANTLFTQGISEYLTKPVEPERLTGAVNTAVKNHVFGKDQFTT